MDASTTNPRIKIYLQDGDRVIGREGTRVGEDGDFLFIENETGKREALAKRLIVRYVEVV